MPGFLCCFLFPSNFTILLFVYFLSLVGSLRLFVRFPCFIRTSVPNWCLKTVNNMRQLHPKINPPSNKKYLFSLCLLEMLLQVKSNFIFVPNNISSPSIRTGRVVNSYKKPPRSHSKWSQMFISFSLIFFW